MSHDSGTANPESGFVVVPPVRQSMTRPFTAIAGMAVVAIASVVLTPWNSEWIFLLCFGGLAMAQLNLTTRDLHVSPTGLVLARMWSGRRVTIDLANHGRVARPTRLGGRYRSGWVVADGDGKRCVLPAEPVNLEPLLAAAEAAGAEVDRS